MEKFYTNKTTTLTPLSKATLTPPRATPTLKPILPLSRETETTVGEFDKV